MSGPHDASGDQIWSCPFRSADLRMLEVREGPDAAGRGPDEVGKDTMAKQRAQRAQVRRPQLAATERRRFLTPLAVGNQTTLSQAETVGCFRRSHCAMRPLCPACEQPMKEYDRAFQCEPCREIIIFFAVSDASPHIAEGKSHQARRIRTRSRR
jgi:hypothetical protein